MYPNFTEEEKSVLRQFVRKYEEENGYYEPLIGPKETYDYPNYIPNIVFLIYHMRNEEPDHPNYRLKQYNKTISKMNPSKVKILENVLDDFKEYMMDRRKERSENRKSKKTTKPKRKVCKCKK